LLAEALNVADLADLIGDRSLPVASVGKVSHDRTLEVADALLASTPAGADAEPDLRALTEQVDEASQRWVRQPDQKPSTAVVLPALLQSARVAARVSTAGARAAGSHVFARTEPLRLAAAR
jgi:hypothetical protein